jgi:hypothetical protein
MGRDETRPNPTHSVPRRPHRAHRLDDADRVARHTSSTDLDTSVMYAALSSKLSAFATRVAPAPHRVAERKPRTAVIECAHKKGTGSTKNGRDSNPKYLGVKKFGEEKVQVGSIIVRQRGNKVGATRDSSDAREKMGDATRFRVSASTRGGVETRARAIGVRDETRSRSMCSRDAPRTTRVTRD